MNLRKVAILGLLSFWPMLALTKTQAPLITDGNFIQPSPFDDWQTIQTHHFNIHFRQQHLDFALRMADLAERIHHKYSPLMQWNPHTTEIVINDSVDYSNGYATPINYNQFFIYMSPPVSGDLMDHMGWIELLFTHEYTHILHFDQVAGAPKTVRNIFGRGGLSLPFAFPELFGPKWSSEGIAIYNESRKGFGRANSATYHSKMRSEVFQGLRDFSEESYEGYYNSRWPFGQVYLYGAYWYQFLYDTYGEAKVIEYITNYNHNLIPWRMHTRSVRTFQKTSDEIWQDFQSYLQKRFQPQIDQIQKGPNHPTLVIENQPFSNSLVTAANDSVIYYHNDQINHPEIRQTDKNGMVSRLLKAKSVSALDYHPQSGLLISKSTVCNNTDQYNDLFVYNLRTEKLRQITQCARTPRSAWTKDGQTIYAIQMNGGKNHLVKADPKTGEIQTISSLQYGEAVGGFDLSRDEKYLIASVKREKTGWNLEKLDLKTLGWQKITLSPYKEHRPKLSEDQQHIYYLRETDDFQQIELHRLNLATNQITQMTNSIGYIEGFDLIQSQPSQAWLQQYTATHTEIAYLPNLEPLFAATENEQDPVNLSALFTSQPDFNPNRFKTLFNKNLASPEVTSPKSYNSLDTLAPTNWSPVFLLGKINPFVGVNINGRDVLGFHQWSLAPIYFYDNEIQKLGGIASYDFYNRLTLSAQNTVITTYDTGSKPKLISYDDTTRIQVLTHYPINQMDYAWDFSLAAAQEKTTTFNILDTTQSHAADNLVGGVIQFNNLNQYSHGISVTDGLSAELTVESYDALANSDHQGVAVIGQLAGYLNLGRKHTLKLSGLYAEGGDHIKPFQLGDQTDAASSIGSFTQLGKRDFALRGYAPSIELQGTQARRLTLEYRYPIAMIYDGFSEYPFGIGKIWGNVFSDTGSASNNAQKQSYYTGAGVELNAELLIGFDSLNIPFSIGYAHGFDPDIGDDQFYLKIGFTL